MLELAPGIVIVLVFFIAVSLMLAKSKKDGEDRNTVNEIIDEAVEHTVLDHMVDKPKSSSFDSLPAGSIEHTIYTCYMEGKRPAEIVRDPRLAEWKSKGKIYDKIIYVEYVGLQMIKEGLIDSTHEGIKADKTFKPIGNVDPVCPCCNFKFDRKPRNKKKCPNCGSLIYLTTRPYDRERVLVSESQAKEIKEQWNRYHNR
jgi:hypothetical protein